MATVRYAMTGLASLCDGAIRRDHQGFNKNDAGFAWDLLSHSQWTRMQEQAAHKLLYKYRSQLRALGIDYDKLNFETDETPKQETRTGPMKLDFSVNTQRFKLYTHFSYKDKAKSLPTARWNPDEKCWTFEAIPQLLQALRPDLRSHLIEPTPEAMSILVELGRELKRWEMIDQLKGGQRLEIDVPLKSQPYEHQVKAFHIGVTVDQAGLLMEQGTGKTLAAIAVVGHRFQQNQVQKVLVVAPLSVVGVWKSEFEKHAAFPYTLTLLTRIKNDERENRLRQLSNFGLSVAVINYEGVWRCEELLMRWKPDMIILDESQRIKNGKTKQAKACHRLGDHTKYKLILTGTPVSQSPLDVWSQYRFLNPTIFGKSFVKFRDRYAIMGGYGGYEVMGYRDLEDLAEKAHSIAYRVTKEEALELPPTIDQILEVPLKKEVKDLYRDMNHDFIVTLGESDTATAPIVLTKLLRLQQITGGFIKLDDGRSEFLGSEKLRVLQDLLEDLPVKKKVVIVARFLEEIKMISEVCRICQREFVTLTGAVKNREEVIEKFQTDPKTTVMIMQIQTGGLGITLTAADTVIFYSTTFSYTDFEQAKARVHRIGQTHKVTYIHLVTMGTVDEHIQRVLESKGSTAELVVDMLRRELEAMKKKSKSELELEAKLKALRDELESQAPEDPPVKAPEQVAPAGKKKIEKTKKSAEAPRLSSKVASVTEAKEENSGPVVTAKELAAEFDITPQQLRKKLRKLSRSGKIQMRENGRWEWPANSKILKQIREALGA